MITSAILAGGALVLMFVAAMMIRNAEQRCADARVDASTKAGQLAIATADIATWKNTAAAEKERADALDDVLDEVATSGDAAGARSRVLSQWTRKHAGTGPHAADGAGPIAVPPSPAAESPGPEGLLRPGD